MFTLSVKYYMIELGVISKFTIDIDNSKLDMTKAILLVIGVRLSYP